MGRKRTDADRLYDHIYRQKHKAKLRAYQRHYHNEHKAAINLRRRKLRLNGPKKPS